MHVQLTADHRMMAASSGTQRTFVSLLHRSDASEQMDVHMCPVTEFGGKLKSLCDVEDHMFNWLDTTACIGHVK